MALRSKKELHHIGFSLLNVRIMFLATGRMFSDTVYDTGQELSCEVA